MSLAKLAARDLRLEWRTRETALPLLLLAILVVAIGLLAFHDLGGGPTTVAAVLWTALALAASVGAARAFVTEADRHTIDDLLALPVERSTVYLAKVVHASVLTLLVGALALALQLALDPVAPTALLRVAPVLVLGAVGLAAATTMVGALAARARARDLLLPVLALPLLVPLLISGVHGTLHALTGEPMLSELLVLAGYDVAFLGASALLADEVLG